MAINEIQVTIHTLIYDRGPRFIYPCLTIQHGYTVFCSLNCLVYAEKFIRIILLYYLDLGRLRFAFRSPPFEQTIFLQVLFHKKFQKYYISLPQVQKMLTVDVIKRRKW